MGTVESYVEAFPVHAASRLREMRDVVRQAAPESEETIKWGVPAYSEGTILVTFAGFKNHLNLYATPSTVEAFASRLSSYRIGRSSIQFPYVEALPRGLITDVVRYRVEEWRVRGIRWM